MVRTGRTICETPVRGGIAGALSLVLGLAAWAQQEPSAQGTGLAQLSGRSRGLTNLAAPSQASDTFRGEDKTGPYILTWRNIEAGLNGPVQVQIDGHTLLPGTYAIDAGKGEITFAAPLKKSAMARVVYGFYPGVAQRNENSVTAAPLSFAFGKLQLAAVSGGFSGAPSVVLGYNDRTTLLGGGLKTQFLFAPDASRGLNHADESAFGKAGIRLGYEVGGQKNGLNLSFLRGGRDFATTLGKGFGMADPTQALGLAGRLSPSRWLSARFASDDTRDLLGRGGGAKQDIGLQFGGTSGLPTLNFARTGEARTDTKGVHTEAKSEKTDLAFRRGFTDLSARSTRSFTLGADKKPLENNQQVIGLNLTPRGAPTLNLLRTADTTLDAKGIRTEATADKADARIGSLGLALRNQRTEVTGADKKTSLTDLQTFGVSLAAKKRPSLSFLRTEEGKTDAGGARTEVATDTADLAGTLGSANLTAQNLRTVATDAARKATFTDRQTFGVSLAAKNRPAIGFLRADETMVGPAGTRAETATNKADLTGKFGSAEVIAKSMQARTSTSENARSRADQSTLGLNLAAKNRPTLSFLRTEDTRTDAAGFRTGAISDKREFAGKFGGAEFSAKSLRADNATPDKKQNATLQSALAVKLPALAGRSLLQFQRTDDQKQQNFSDWFGTLANRLDFAHRLGTAEIGYLSLQTTTLAVDKKQTDSDTETIGVKLPGKGTRPTVGFARTIDEKTENQTTRTAITTDKADLTSTVGGAQVAANTQRSLIDASDPKAAGTAHDTALSLSASGAAKGTGATIAVSGGATQTGGGLEQRQGLSLTLKPSPAVAITAEQKDQTILPVGGATRNVTSQGASAELRPGSGAFLTGAWRTNVDGDKTTQVVDYGARFGLEKSALQFDGALTNRQNPAGGLAALDTARATFRVRPLTGVTLSGNYLLNPEEKGQINPMTRREYGVDAHVGRLELGGTYAETELSSLTPAAVRQKAGADEYGEYSLSLGLSFSPATRFSGSVKNSFFTRSATPRGLRSYVVGFTHNAGSSFVALNGTFTTNRALAGAAANDYKAEAKLGVRF